MTRESATSGHTRQLPPGDKTKEKQTRHATKTNQKTKSRKRLSQTFCYFFFFLDLEFCSFTSREKLLFFFRTLFSLQLVINQAANVTISQRTNRTPEIRLEHIPSWSQAKKNMYIRKEKERRTNCMLDVNKPKQQRCTKEVGFQFQGGRGTSLRGGGGVKLPATHANWRRSSEKHAATLQQDQPTTRWYTRKLKHGDLNATQRTRAHNSLDRKLKTVRQPALIATAATKEAAATFRSNHTSNVARITEAPKNATNSVANPHSRQDCHQSMSSDDTAEIGSRSVQKQHYCL